MIPDLIFDADKWVDAYALSGIAAGRKLIIQNKTPGSTLLVYAASSLPSSDSHDGYMLRYQDMPMIVDASSDGCFLRMRDGAGHRQARVYVQEMTE